MKTHRSLLQLGLVAFLAVGCSITQVSAQGNWTQLFDGKTLNGWTQRGGKARYEVKNSAIVGTTVTGTPNSFLCTDKEYGDFEMELEFKVATNMNSGVQIRSQCFDEPKKMEYQGKTLNIPAKRVHGYQVEIDPSKRAWTGGIYDEGRRGWLFDLKNNPTAQKAFKQGTWNHFRVVCKGDSIKTWVNGVAAADLKDDMTLKGFIALQVHSAKEAGVEISWRNIRLREY